MILTVCLSPAVDVTYRVGRLVAGTTHRVAGVSERAGGKAVNVARVLHTLGEDVRLVAPAGDGTGDELRRRLEEAALPATLVPTAVPTRRTVTVVEDDGSRATLLVEPARIDCWPDVLAAAEAALAQATVLVLSGSIPEGVPAGGVAAVVASGRRHGAQVVVDTHGPALREALGAGATVVKPNAEELAGLAPGEPLSAARGLATTYAATVVASLGADGLVAAGPHGAWEARPARPLAGNPTGAGDALVAGLARALHRDAEALARPEQALRDAVALSAAAVLAPEAGDVDPAHHRAQLAGVVVRALDGAR